MVVLVFVGVVAVALVVLLVLGTRLDRRLGRRLVVVCVVRVGLDSVLVVVVALGAVVDRLVIGLAGLTYRARAFGALTSRRGANLAHLCTIDLNELALGAEVRSGFDRRGGGRGCGDRDADGFFPGCNLD